MKRAAVVSLLLTIAGLSAGCGPAVDVTKGVRVEAVSTGWVNAGVVDGMNKLVPAVSFTLKNVSNQKLPALQVNAVFRRVATSLAKHGVTGSDVLQGRMASRQAPPLRH